MAKNGPSPLIPLLLVAALGLVLRGNSFPLSLNLPNASEAENVIFTCFLFVPFLALGYTFMLPLAILFVVYMVSTMLLGPLVLILAAYIATKCSTFFGGNGEELGWGCLLLLVFFLLQWASIDEGRWSGPVFFVAVVMFVCCHVGS
ncbi:Unknown protein [Striga hermonthica]|uniref:Uncharacterized protein n=1 Tax=Striga hermonthica TaxID=68872 RepID=A0A9N7RP65_STRHE|nr:Unknown protein [Striga hermonthica]